MKRPFSNNLNVHFRFWTKFRVRHPYTSDAYYNFRNSIYVSGVFDVLTKPEMYKTYMNDYTKEEKQIKRKFA